MAEEKKPGHLRPETKEKLKLCLEMAGTEKEGRGDKVWLYKGAKEALSCMEKLKRILNDDELTRGNTDERSVTPEQQAAKVLEGVMAKLEERKQRPS